MIKIIALALLRGKGILDGDRIEYTGTGEDLTATWHFRRASWPKDRWEKSSFSVREARSAQLVKRDSNWDKWPKRMTLWRAIGFACKDYFSDVLFGFEIGEPAANGRTEPTPPAGADGSPRAPAPSGDDPLKAMALGDEPAANVVDAEYVVDGQKVTEPPSTDEEVPPEPHLSDEERLLRLNNEILARTQDDADARKQLLKEIAVVADGKGVDAAERALIEHEVFGGPIQAEIQ